MTVTTADALVRDYLARLSERSGGLPPDRREELLDEVREHIAAARASGVEDEASTRNVLDRLGTPEEIVQAAEDPAERTGRPPGRREPRLRWRDIAALVLLPLGGVAIGIGWIIGVVLVWSSDRWRAWEKLLATLVWPFGYPLVLVAGGFATFQASATGCSTTAATLAGSSTDMCTSAGSVFPSWLVIVLAVIAFLAPVLVLALLAKRGAPGRG